MNGSFLIRKRTQRVVICNRLSVITVKSKRIIASVIFHILYLTQVLVDDFAKLLKVLHPLGSHLAGTLKERVTQNLSDRGSLKPVLFQALLY